MAVRKKNIQTPVKVSQPTPGAVLMADKRLELKKKKENDVILKKQSYKRCIDTEYNYYSNAVEFSEHLLSERENDTIEKYFQNLITYREKYSLALEFYQKWGDDKAALGEDYIAELRRILKKIDSEINIIKEVILLKGYETDSLKEIFYPYSIKQYLEIEKRLQTSGFIDENFKWIKQRKELVAFIHILNNNNYFKPITGKNTNSFFKYYRRFFENRYKIDISDAAKPSNFKLNDEKQYQATFYFIKPAK